MFSLLDVFFICFLNFTLVISFSESEYLDLSSNAFCPFIISRALHWRYYSITFPVMNTSYQFPSVW